jgi:hypothetical protein
LLDDQFGLVIDVTCRLVEHQQRRVFEHRTGDCKPLALAARELHPALADNRPEFVLKLGDELPRASPVERGDNLVVGCVGYSVGDVFPNCPAE